MTWDEIDRDEWDALAGDAPLQQAWRWGDVLAAAGARVERRAHRDGGRVTALAQVATRRVGPLAVSLLSRGPVQLGATPASIRGLVRALAPATPRVLLATPETGVVAGGVPLVTPAWHAALDLRPPAEELLRGFNPKLRNKVARAGRAGLAVRREPWSAGAWLLEAERAQARARRYRNWPPALVDVWHGHGGETALYVARAGSEPVAAMLFLLHGRIATYHIGWAGAEGRRLAAHPLCLWRAIGELQAAGIQRIDLGTVNTEDAPGLARFKIATGATVGPLGATCLVTPWL